MCDPVLGFCLVLANLIGVDDAFKVIDRLGEFSLAEIKMCELESGVCKRALRCNFLIKPDRVSEIVFASLGCRCKQSFDVGFECTCRHLVCRLDQLVLRERKSLVALVKDLVCNLTLHRLQVAESVVQHDVALHLSAVDHLAQKTTFV